jgi:hypothetical protein
MDDDYITETVWDVIPFFKKFKKKLGGTLQSPRASAFKILKGEWRMV